MWCSVYPTWTPNIVSIQLRIPTYSIVRDQILCRSHFWHKILCWSHFRHQILHQSLFWQQILSRSHYWHQILSRSHYWHQILGRSHFWHLILRQSHFWHQILCHPFIQVFPLKTSLKTLIRAKLPNYIILITMINKEITENII